MLHQEPVVQLSNHLPDENGGYDLVAKDLPEKKDVFHLLYWNGMYSTAHVIFRNPTHRGGVLNPLHSSSAIALRGGGINWHKYLQITTTFRQACRWKLHRGGASRHYWLTSEQPMNEDHLWKDRDVKSDLQLDTIWRISRFYFDHIFGQYKKIIPKVLYIQYTLLFIKGWSTSFAISLWF